MNFPLRCIFDLFVDFSPKKEKHKIYLQIINFKCIYEIQIQLGKMCIKRISN